MVDWVCAVDDGWAAAVGTDVRRLWCDNVLFLGGRGYVLTTVCDMCGVSGDTDDEDGVDGGTGACDTDTGQLECGVLLCAGVCLADGNGRGTPGGHLSRCGCVVVR